MFAAKVEVVRKLTESTTFAGIRGSVGDTGLTYLTGFKLEAKSRKVNKMLSDTSLRP